MLKSIIYGNAGKRDNIFRKIPREKGEKAKCNSERTAQKKFGRKPLISAGTTSKESLLQIFMVIRTYYKKVSLSNSYVLKSFMSLKLVPTH